MVTGSVSPAIRAVYRVHVYYVCVHAWHCVHGHGVVYVGVHAVGAFSE